MRIGRSPGFREYVVYTRTLQYRAHSATGDYAGTRRRRLQQHMTAAELADRFMGDRATDDRHLHQMLLCIIDAFGDRVGHFVGLAQAITDYTVTITHHHDGGKAETAATLYHLRATLDGDNPFLQVDLACLIRAAVAYSHIYYSIFNSSTLLQRIFNASSTLHFF